MSFILHYPSTVEVKLVRTRLVKPLGVMIVRKQLPVEVETGVELRVVKKRLVMLSVVEVIGNSYQWKCK